MARRKIQFAWDQGLPDGRCLFANIIRKSDGAYWNDTDQAFETYNPSNVADYGVQLQAVITNTAYPDGVFLFDAEYPSAIGAVETTQTICLGLTTTPGLAGALVPVVDQQQLLGTQIEVMLASYAWGQSFIPSAPTVHSIKFFGYSRPEGDIVVPVSIRAAIDGPDLAITSVRITAGGGVEDFGIVATFPEPVTVTPGQKYFVVLLTWQNSQGSYSLMLKDEDGLVGTSRELYDYVGGNTWTARTGWSFKFQEYAATGKDTPLAVIQTQGYVVQTPGPVVFVSTFDVPGGYFIVVDEHGQFWNTVTSEFEDFNGANWADYAIALPGADVDGTIRGTYPTAIEADTYTLELLFGQVGADPDLDADLILTWAHTQGQLVPLLIDATSLPSTLEFALQPAGVGPGAYLAASFDTAEPYAQMQDVGVLVVVQFVTADGDPIDISPSPSKLIRLGDPNGFFKDKVASFVTDGSDGKIYFATTYATHTVTGNTLDGSAIVLLVVPDTSDLYPGMPVSGTGIPAGATIASVDSDEQITLSAEATADGTAVSLACRDYDFGQLGRYAIQGKVTGADGEKQSTERGTFTVRQNVDNN